MVGPQAKVVVGIAGNGVARLRESQRVGRDHFEHVCPRHGVKTSLQGVVSVGSFVENVETEIDLTRRKGNHAGGGLKRTLAGSTCVLAGPGCNDLI
jgi:hypothetical protein